MVSCIPEFKEGIIDDNFRFFVMGCDGIWETKSDEKICLYLAKEEDTIKNWSLGLLGYVMSRKIKEKWGKDNMSLIVI